jgi:tetratricopeptide (TPR) repeat protein/predicted Ser/Thr protein kinase
MAEPRMQPDSIVPSVADLTGTTVGRFAILELLGRGGMGEVYRANDVRLKRQVALKRVAPALRDDHRSRQQLWKEAEWASRLSDPHIAAIHDVIEEENELFIVMEYVEGQTLRRRLTQPLAISEFLSIASQCAEALAAAHKAGLVHRDIKPENIMLTSSALVKVLDFGVAKNLPGLDESTTLSTRARPEFAGTLMYMAPEIVQDKEPDARADIFSLGVVFYEALAGRNPFRAEGFLAICDRIVHQDPPPLHELNSRVPPELERIVGKMLAKDPAQRYSSAADLVVDLEALRRSSAPSRISSSPQADAAARPLRRRLILAGLAVLTTVAIAGVLVYRRSHAAVLTPHAAVLLADFDNLTGEKLFDNTVTEAMRQALAQSRYVRLVPQAQVLEAAARMGRNNISHLDAALGREICRRENFSALLTGRIEPAAGKYSLTVQVVDPREGSPILTQSASLRSPSELYAAADGLARNLRNRLGESLSQVNQNSQPLAKVTTPSLEALQRYSRAMDFYAAADFEDFLPLARSAIELDPDFAMAHLYLARVYGWRGDLQYARAELAQARKNSDRVTERERFMILATGFEFDGLYEKAAEQYRLLTEVYPDDLDGYRGLAEASAWAGRAEEGLAAQKHALDLNPNGARDHGVLISYLNRLNRFDEALADFHAAQAKGIKSPRLHWGVGLARLGQGDTLGARQEFELLRKEGGPYEESLATLCFARVLMFEGRLREATDAFRSGIVLGEKLHSETWIPVQHYLLAQALRARGQVSEARAEVRRLAQAANSPPQEHELRRGGLLAVQLGDLRTARQLLAQLADLSAKRDSGYTKSSYYNLKGAVELATRDVESAIESQRRAAVFFPSYEIPPALGNAYAARQEWRSAAQAYQRYLEFKGEILSDDSPTEWVLAHLALARVLAKSGDTKQALQSYDEFLRLWAHADPGLPALREAHAERDRLSKTLAPGAAETQGIPQAR